MHESENIDGHLFCPAPVHIGVSDFISWLKHFDKDSHCYIRFSTPYFSGVSPIKGSMLFSESHTDCEGEKSPTILLSFYHRTP